MKIIAMYKVWSGEEWLEPSVDSIINHVDSVVILYSNISWIGARDNPSKAAVGNIQAKYGDKIHVLYHDDQDQISHCLYGYIWIQKNLDCDYVQLVDSDEVWDSWELEKAHYYLAKNPGYPSYRTQIYTYIKKATYRVEPVEPLKPVCFVASNLRDLSPESRACSVKPFFIMPDVYFHHFVFVRAHFNRVLEKLIQSHVSENQNYSSMDVWIPEVWNKLPRHNRKLWPKGFHPAIGFAHNWRGLKKISRDELPKVLKDYSYVYDFGT